MRRPPDYVVSDDLTWLNDLINDVTGENTDIKAVTAERLREEYCSFRAGHGTRTSNLAEFYENGLRVLQADEIEDRARSVFLNGQFKYATEERLQHAIDEIEARNPAGGREGRLHYCAHEEELFSRAGSSGQYLTYGSEYLYCLGIRITNSWETKKALTANGKPTMFVCDIPMGMIRSSTLEDFAGSILEYLFCELVDELESHALSPGAGSALSVAENLPAACIVGHYHPAAIYDPLRFT